MRFWAGYYTPDGKWEDGCINLSTADIVSSTARDTKDGFAYAQELELVDQGAAKGMLKARLAFRFFSHTDGAERFLEIDLEAFPMPAMMAGAEAKQ